MTSKGVRPVSKLYPNKLGDINDPFDEISSLLLQIAEDCIPKTSGKARRRRPWIDDDCKTSIKSVRQLYGNSRLPPHLEIYKGSTYFELKLAVLFVRQERSPGNPMYRT